MKLSPSPVSSPSHEATDSPGSNSFPAVHRLYSVHDWESYKQKDFYDDGTMTFFWRAHTLTVLFLFSCALVYVALFEDLVTDQEYNSKRGLIACIVVFLLLGVTQIPDGPFRRPHPVLWRFVFCSTVVYELSLIFILFQSPTDARQLLTHIDKDLGKPLEEKDYGGNCRLYDHDVPSNPFHNILDKFDVFVPSHLFGWWVKMLMIRDWWLCTVVSIMFEFLEYTLEHQLPNFSECWWDHWIMDALVCNGLGIYLGLLTLNYLSIKTYHWRGLWNIPGYRGKLQRIVAQFGPHSWIEFDWKPTSSLSRWLCVIFIICALLLAELNTFYLKFVLWLEPTHYLNPARLVLVVLGGAVALRESFEYLDNLECKKFGRQSWVMMAIVITEFLIIVKFDWNTITKPLPTHIRYCWILGTLSLTAWTVWNFFPRSKRIYLSKDSSPDRSEEFHTRSRKQPASSSSLAAAESRTHPSSSPDRDLRHRRPSTDGTISNTQHAKQASQRISPLF